MTTPKTPSDLERAIEEAKEIQVLPDGPVILTKEQGGLLASALLSVVEENERLKKIEKLYPGIVADWEAAETAKGILELKFEDTSAQLEKAEEVIRLGRGVLVPLYEAFNPLSDKEADIVREAYDRYENQRTAYFASSREKKGEG